MTTLLNSFEGGTSGTTISTGNSGGASGNAFNSVTVGSGCTVAYSNTVAAHGALSAEFATPVSAANALVLWTTSLTGTSLPQVWVRGYVYLLALPTGGSTLRIINTRSGSAICGVLGITPAGKVVTLNSSGSPQTTSTTTVPVNQWFRLEGYVIGDPSVGQLQVQIFLSPDSATPTETNTTPATVDTNTTINRVDYGNPTSIASYTFYMDNLGASSTGYIGPVVTTSAPRGTSIVPALIAMGGPA